MDIIIPALIIFLVTIAVIELFSMAARNAHDPNRGTVRKRLRSINQRGEEHQAVTDIRKQKREFSGSSIMQRLYALLPGAEAFNKLLIQSNCRYNLGTVVLTSLLLGFVSLLILMYFRISFPVTMAAGVFAAFVPWLILLRRRNGLLEKYRRQLPEAASLIARSLRAGHALPTGLGMVAEEFGSPIGPAFAEVVEEINYGGSINDALKNLSLRFDIQETHFFTMGVALQRETGGNLAEILDNLAGIIRERFRLENKVKILSAESRLTAWAMAIIPFVVLVALHIINPKHTQFLMEDPTGRTAVLVALIMIALGVLMMRKMINFKI